MTSASPKAEPSDWSLLLGAARYAKEWGLGVEFKNAYRGLRRKGYNVKQAIHWALLEWDL